MGSESQDDFTRYLKRNNIENVDNLSVSKRQYLYEHHSKNSSSCSPVTASNILNRVPNEESKKLIEDSYMSKGFKTPGVQPNIEFNNLKKHHKKEETKSVIMRYSTQDYNKGDNLQSYQQNIPQQDLLSPYNHQKKRKKRVSDEESDSNSGSGRSECSGKSHALLSQYTISTLSCVSQNRGKKWQINNYEVLQDIGQGKFATVKKVKDKTTKQCFAMKIINKYCLQKKKLGPSKSQFTQVEKEVAIMKKMGHPYIVKLIEIIDDPNHHKQFLI